MDTATPPQQQPEHTARGLLQLAAAAETQPAARDRLAAQRAAGHEFRSVIFEGHVIAGCTCGWDEMHPERHLP